MTIFRVDQATLRQAGHMYLVQPGDTLSKIAQQRYGHVRFWPVIWAYNMSLNPHLLPVGKELFVPPLSGPLAPQAELITLAAQVWNRI